MSTDLKLREYPVDPLAFSRFEICKKCKFYLEENTRCELCGCNIRRATNEDKAECPVGKW